MTDQDVATRLGIQPVPVDPSLKVGIALATVGETPINGLRHSPMGDVSGWYLWGGTHLASDPDFFAPLHASHLGEYLPEVIPYLSLPAGYRFLIAPQYEDVWFDEDLLAEQWAQRTDVRLHPETE